MASSRQTYDDLSLKKNKIQMFKSNFGPTNEFAPSSCPVRARATSFGLLLQARKKGSNTRQEKCCRMALK